MENLTANSAILVTALVLLSAMHYVGAARPQLTLRASDAVIGLEAGTGKGTEAVKLCGEDPDEICNLPGLNGPPHVRMRSGYITVSEVSDRRLWYLVAQREQEQQPRANRQQQQQQDAAEAADAAGDGDDGVARRRRRDGDDEDAAPVILWLTGGPGCSSLDAFIYEHGPFRFSYAAATAEAQAEAEAEAEAASEGGGRSQARDRKLQQQRTVRLEPNPYSWTKLATVIYVDSPAGAGFSFSGRPEVDYHTNDEYTIADLVAFLQGLTERYPELATAPFFLSGESYGGVFVPLLAQELVHVNRRRREEGKEPLVDLRGYTVGNPVTDDVIDGNAQMFFAADMGYVDPPSWRYMRAACDDMFWNATRGTECYDAQGVIKDDLWDLNWYDVLDPCVRPDDDDDDDDREAAVEGAAASSASSGSSGRAAGAARKRRDPADLERRFYWPFTARMGAPTADVQQGQQAGGGEEQVQLEAGRRGGRRLWGPWLRHVVPCMDRRLALDWLNRAEVRSALHAAPASSIGGWQPCSDVLYYRLDTMDLVPVHQQLVREGIRALVYSGDHDMVVPHTGTRTWLYDEADLGSPDGPLRPWMMNGQIAGFTARFDAGTGLRFATVKGAGHMVPQSKPAQALRLLRAFLYDEEL